MENLAIFEVLNLLPCCFKTLFSCSIHHSARLGFSRISRTSLDFPFRKQRLQFPWSPRIPRSKDCRFQNFRTSRSSIRASTKGYSTLHFSQIAFLVRCFSSWRMPRVLVYLVEGQPNVRKTKRVDRLDFQLGRAFPHALVRQDRGGLIIPANGLPV